MRCKTRFCRDINRGNLRTKRNARNAGTSRTWWAGPSAGLLAALGVVLALLFAAVVETASVGQAT